MSIHEDHPFATPAADRDPVRRFRGRLVSPVTIVTAGSGANRTGLTVGSLMVAEGAPSVVHLLVGYNAALSDVISETGKFVVHICDAEHRRLAETFAGIRPAPGGMFRGIDAMDSDWGPAMTSLASRLYCTMHDSRDLDFHQLVSAVIDRVDVADEADDPLAYFRGTYRALDPERGV